MSQSIPESGNSAEVTRLPEDVKKDWLKAKSKFIKTLINNKTFLMDEPENIYPTTPCMNIFKAKIQSYGIFDNLKLRHLVRVYLKNKEIIGDTCSLRESMRDIKHFLEYTSNNISRLHQLDCIGEFLQANVKHRVFGSWTVDMENTSQNVETILEDH